MTKKNTLDEILKDYGRWCAMASWPEEAEKYTTFDQAKKEIAQAIEDAKPEKFKFEDGNNDATHFFNKAIEEYHQNLKERLGL